jgi:hypothetical protein
MSKRIVFWSAVIGAVVGLIGCGTTVQHQEIESVGELHASASSVYQAPVHATTNLGHSFISSDDMETK